MPRPALQASEPKIEFIDCNNFVKGLNTIDDPVFLDVSESPNMINMDITKQGSIQTRYGYELVSTIPTATGGMKGILPYYKTYGTSSGDYLILFHGNGNIYYITNSNTTPTLIGSYGSVGGVVRGIVYNNWAIFNNGATGNVVQKWDVSALAALGGSPQNGKYFATFANRLFLAGISTNPNNVYFSEYNDPEDWVGGGWEPINVGDGQDVNGMVPNIDYLQIFKENSLYALGFSYDDTTQTTLINIRPDIQSSDGSIANGSLQSIYGYTYYLSRRGIQQFGPSINYNNLPFPLSLKIDPTIQKINNNMYDSINSAFYQNRYMMACALSQSPVNNAILIYDENIKRRFGQDAWTVYTGIPALQFGVFRNTKKQDELYFVSQVEPKLFKFNKTFSDDGAGYQRLWRSKTFRFGERTYYRWLDIEGYMTQNCTIYVDIWLDGQQQTFTIDSSNFVLSGLGTGYIGDHYIGDDYVGGGEAGDNDPIPMYHFKHRIMIPMPINQGYMMYFQLRNIDEGQGWRMTRYRLAYTIDPEDPTYARAY